MARSWIVALSAECLLTCCAPASGVGSAGRARNGQVFAGAGDEEQAPFPLYVKTMGVRVVLDWVTADEAGIGCPPTPTTAPDWNSGPFRRCILVTDTV